MTEPTDAETDALFALVRDRYGARLTPEQLDDVRRIVAGQVTLARLLRAVKLRNSDEPLQPFVPFRADERSISPAGAGDRAATSPESGA